MKRASTLFFVLLAILLSSCGSGSSYAPIQTLTSPVDQLTLTSVLDSNTANSGARQWTFNFAYGTVTGGYIYIAACQSILNTITTTTPLVDPIQYIYVESNAQVNLDDLLNNFVLPTQSNTQITVPTTTGQSYYVKITTRAGTTKTGGTRLFPGITEVRSTLINLNVA